MLPAQEGLERRLLVAPEWREPSRVVIAEERLLALPSSGQQALSSTSALLVDEDSEEKRRTLGLAGCERVRRGHRKAR